jgi:hypothetical protein
VTSIYQRALGSDFDRLHPEIQRRFSLSSADGTACVGVGVMDRMWHGKPYVKPFLALGAARHILVPERGDGIPFTIENYAYLDSFGRETITFNRTFQVSATRRRRFDATMIYSERRRQLVDYLGTHQHLASDLDLRVDHRGGLCMRSGAHRFREGPLDVRVPEMITGDALAREWFDEDTGRFRIDVRVVNKWFGPLFGYHGSFTVRYLDTESGVPASVKPLREEGRE